LYVDPDRCASFSSKTSARPPGFSPAESHHGTLTLDDSGPSGSTFVARLPMTPAATAMTAAAARPTWAAYARRVGPSNPTVASDIANFACRDAAFCELGGFAPDYLRDEDREFNLRLWRAGKRGMYVDSIVAYAEVQRERLTKRYHRAWHHVPGASHARLRYRDTIDRDGRLDDGVAARARVWRGVPGFLYRELATHAARWIKHMVTSRRDAAFLDECRLRYLTSYVKTRWHGRGGHGAPQ
jgi:hypothetical protein